MLLWGNCFYSSSLNRMLEGRENVGSTFAAFDHAEVDGTTVNATTASGSVVVTLEPADLNALEIGEHVLTVYFKDGLKMTASFTIAEAVEPEPTPTPTPTPGYEIPKTGIE